MATNKHALATTIGRLKKEAPSALDSCQSQSWREEDKEAPLNISIYIYMILKGFNFAYVFGQKKGARIFLEFTLSCDRGLGILFRSMMLPVNSTLAALFHHFSWDW